MSPTIRTPGGAGDGATRRTAPPPNHRLRPALIAGAGAGGQLIAAELRNNHQWRLWPVGFVDDDPQRHGTSVMDLPVLGDIETIPLVVEQEGIAVVVLAMPSVAAARLDQIATLATGTGADVMTMPPLGSILSGAQRAETLRRVRMTDVLGRPRVELDMAACAGFLRDERVLVTGAAGSIGSELAAQVAALSPASLILVDTNESGLFDLQLDLQVRYPLLAIEPVVASIADRQVIERTFDRMHPGIVFHAAAYKHVPLMEQYPGEAVRTNVIGTANVARASARLDVHRFVMVSSDKAVRPSSVMGASKRLAEVVVAEIAAETGLAASSVRFGNVLGSRGSVVPTFERQIRLGGPVTVTDRRMRRYFMTIEEAAGLIIQSGSFEQNAIYMLDMGEDVSILALAERVIELHGLRPYVDIPIEFTGKRPGEKLREDLSNDFEHGVPSPHPKIRRLSRPSGAGMIPDLKARLARLEQISRIGSEEAVRRDLMKLVGMADSAEHERDRGVRGTAPAAGPAYCSGDV